MSPHHTAFRSAFLAAAGGAAALLFATPALAHVKWFAPFVVGAAPAPIIQTLTNPWNWLATALVLAFFLAAVAIERSRPGEAVLAGLDRISGPLWARSDDFMRAVVGAFFVAIFAVGGIYLTPDLKTPYELVSWLQLLIAACVFSRRTMPLAGGGILVLWIIALRDYDFFHLLDYLALGLGVAAYLFLASFPGSRLYARRFEVLRWGVAIALMWSSLEKFAYPEWFHPLVEERPFLTFGMPRDVFIPMAGVAEFTLGFGLLWTPLVRRLSALALLVIFFTAVYPFGRVDLVGHALIMGTLVLIAADNTRLAEIRPATKRSFVLVPVALMGTFAIVAASYWGLHAVFYGPEGEAPAIRSTHSFDPEHPHPAPDAPATLVPPRAPAGATPPAE